MKKKVTLIVSHILLIVLIITIFLPGEKAVKSPAAMLAGMALIEAFYLSRFLKKTGDKVAASDIMVIVWGFLLIWEIMVTKLNRMHPVLVPAPENVFHVFREQYAVLLSGVFSSLQLLFIGVVTGLVLGSLFGLICGWIPRLKHVFYPIANVLAPIPSIVFAPYVIAIMPTFRSASAVVVILGVFWPAFLNMIIRVNAIEKNILDSARALNLGTGAMIFQILLPYALPGVINGLKVTMTTAVMMLTFAEMMGATSGMGYYIVNYNTYGNYTNVVAGIAVVGIVVTVLNKLVVWIQKKTIRWQPY
ncbi:MAG: ABC transporter permease [Lachnospiraceae bacterium]|jgi:NitT/TauT family transport system permease protein